MARTKQIQRTTEEINESRLKSELEDINRTIELGLLPLDSSRRFEIGERIHWGAHEEVYIRDIGPDHIYYLVETMKPVGRQSQGYKEEQIPEQHYLTWLDTLPYKSKGTTFAKEDPYFIRLLNSGVSSLLSMVYGSYAGVDFDVDYQRDHVWELKDKVDLIDSIFNNIDIGKFVFVQRHEGTKGRYYEVVDGKQRLTALKEFFEDKFAYKGYYYSELSFRDQHEFTNHGVTYGFLENPDKRGIYETFIKMNTCGKPMDHKHIDKVKELLKELE